MCLFHAVWGNAERGDMWQLSGREAVAQRLRVARLMQQGYGRDLYRGDDGDWNRYVTTLADPTVLNLNGDTTPEAAATAACASVGGHDILRADVYPDGDIVFAPVRLPSIYLAAIYPATATSHL